MQQKINNDKEKKANKIARDNGKNGRVEISKLKIKNNNEPILDLIVTWH